MEKNWDRIVGDYLSNYYNENELKRLCARVGIRWDDLGGNVLAPRDRLDGLLNKVNFSRAYHKLLCEMTDERVPVFRESRLHIHLYEEGIKLVEQWKQSYWQPPEEHVIDPQECSNGAHFVFQTLRKVQEAYLQVHLSEFLNTTALALQAKGEWREAGDLLEEFHADLPDSVKISGLIKGIREVQKLCGEIRAAMENNDWGKANSGYDSLMKAYPSCSSYSEVGELRAKLVHSQELEQPRKQPTNTREPVDQPTISERQLLDAMQSSLDFQDFQLLCFNLGVKSQNLPGQGQGLPVLLLELIGYQKRRGLYAQLVDEFLKMRPVRPGTGSDDDGEKAPPAPTPKPLPPPVPSGPLPSLSIPSNIKLADLEKALIQNVYPDYATVILEKEFGGGFSGTRVFLVLPVKPDGNSDARMVTKIGLAEELRREKANFDQHVKRGLPFTGTQVGEYYEQDGWAALNYIFAGGDELGETLSLEAYYGAHSAEDLSKTLRELLTVLGTRWYSQGGSLNCPLREEYGRHLPPDAELASITASIFPKLILFNDGQVQIPRVPRKYPHPLKFYTRILDQTLEGRQSFVHGDLHLRNILVDKTGKAWLIDFAKVKQCHNLFDFIKLEAYIRLFALAAERKTFKLDEYAQFEHALLEHTAPPANPSLAKAYAVISAIREMAKVYVRTPHNFHKEYLSALFLYCLALMKYHAVNGDAPTQLMFLTVCVLGEYLSGAKHSAHVTQRPSKGEGQTPVAAQMLGAGNHWAMLVGLNEYEDRANYGQLQVCVKDVNAIRENLVAGGFDPARIRLLTDQTDEKPTRAKILAAFQSLANAAEPDDLLLFYYSGHGDQTDGESYLVARDGQYLVLPDTAVPVSKIKQIMEQSQARAKVMILDACHSGVDMGGKGAQPMSAEFIRRVFEEAEGLAILAACKQGQLSYEWRAQECSVFTHFLLEALSGQADRDGKGFVTVQDANRHVINGVKLWASQRNVTQTPTIQYGAAGDIILAMVPPRADKIISAYRVKEE